MQTTARRSPWLLLLALLALGGLTIQAHKGAREATTHFIRSAFNRVADPGGNRALRANNAHQPLNAAEPAKPAQTGGSFDIIQSAVLSNGGRSTGGNFDLTDSVGQSVVGA